MELESIESPINKAFLDPRYMMYWEVNLLTDNQYII